MTNTKVVWGIASSCNRLLILGLLLCFTIIGVVRGQKETLSAPDKAKVRDRIATIIRETLKKGEFTIRDGTKAITRVPPSQQDLNEVRRYGDDAVPELARYLSSDRGREYELAMRFLGELGGSRIVDPLRKVILSDPSPRKREYALRWITQAPWDEGAPIIRQAKETDPDSHVREVAKNLLTQYAPNDLDLPRF